MVVKKTVDFQAKPAELIVIPEAFAFTCGKALHIRFNHPTHSQMKKMFDRTYFMLNSDQILKQVWESCDYPCQANMILPKETMSYKSETIPKRLGSNFHADVLVEAKQKILISRENLSTYTGTMFVENQQKDTLKDGLLILLSRSRLGQQSVSCRVDGQSSLKSLAENQALLHHGISLEVGNSKNKNSNSVIDKACRELRDEIRKLNPTGGPISSRTLAIATENLNNRLRSNNRSALCLGTSRSLGLSDYLISVCY
jgi:hypothetical protein